MSLSDLLPDENYLFDLKIRTEGVGDRTVSSMDVVPEVLGDRGALHAGLLVTLTDAATGRLPGPQNMQGPQHRIPSLELVDLG